MDLNLLKSLSLVFGPMPEIESKIEILIFFRLAALLALIANRCASSLALISKLKRFEFF